MAVKIEKETIIGDILDVAPQSAPLFFAIGMHFLEAYEADQASKTE